MNRSHLRPYRLFFEHRPHYLYVYVESDENSFQIAKGYWVEILSMLCRRRYKRILIEQNVTTRLPAHEAFDLMCELAHSHCSGIRFAVLDHHYDPRECSFEQTVGTNRGLQLRISDDRYELEDWLLEGSSVAPDRRAFPHVPGQLNRPSIVR